MNVVRKLILVSLILLSLLALLYFYHRYQSSPRDLQKDAPKDALGTIMTCSKFSIGGTGYAGVISEAEKAMKLLFKEPNPVDQFKKIIQKASPEGKLYGLLGLYVSNPPVFKEELAAYRSNHWTARRVVTQFGCVFEESTDLAELKKIEKGEYDLYLKIIGEVLPLKQSN